MNLEKDYDRVPRDILYNGGCVSVCVGGIVLKNYGVPELLLGLPGLCTAKARAVSVFLAQS